ncbi:MAG: DUF3768 domain-containing protein [Pseudomonadota bacterium]
MNDEKTRTIQRLNDEFRYSGGKKGHGRLMITEGVFALPLETQFAIVAKVQAYSDFNEGNDPYGEHDFGTVSHKGAKVFWKFDYYNRYMSAGSEDPADPEATSRVLTIMLAREY